jgi:putative (di)nucleoside polyphosphate hydrolase
MTGQTFRAGVGMIVRRGDGLVLAIARSDVPGAWQLPQGGLEPGEDPEDAAWRELAEETGLGQEHVRLTRSLDAWLGYELPAELRSAKTGRGQVHMWFEFELRIGTTIPSPPANARTEVNAVRWMNLAQLIEMTVAFRRPAYRLLLKWLDERMS